MLNYNKVQFVPEELSCCESLERLELAMNQDLNRLPDKVWATSLAGVTTDLHQIESIFSLLGQVIPVKKILFTVG